MFDKILSQVFFGKLALLQQVRCRGKITGQRANMTALNRPGNCVLVVGVPLQAFGQFQLPLDSIEAAGKRRGEDQVEVGIRAWNAIFNADGAPPIVDDTN